MKSAKQGRAVDEKVMAVNAPGEVVEFTPEEAEELGAFEELALSEEDALRSVQDEQE